MGLFGWVSVLIAALLPAPHKAGKTALDHAKAGGHSKVARLLADR